MKCLVSPIFLTASTSNTELALILLDPRQRRIGYGYQGVVSELLHTLAVYPFTKRLGMTIQEVNRLVSQARIDAANPSLRAYFPL